MGEGRAARNTLPVCQELLARVGLGGAAGARAPETAHLVPRGPAATRGQGHPERDPQPPAALCP